MNTPTIDRLRIRLAQMEVVPGAPEANAERMLALIAAARRERVDLIAFPEMAIPGYLLGDHWERDAFLRDCEHWGHRVREATDGIVAVFGNVGMDWARHNEDGRARKYNAVFVAADRRFAAPQGGELPFAAKALMPNYREFDDSRYFFDLRKLAQEKGVPVEQLIQPVTARGVRIGCLLCEDAWDSDYALSPMQVLARHGAQVFINCSCSPFTVNKNHKRNRIFSVHADEFRRPMAYVNNVGVQNNGKTVFTFDGGTCVYDGLGHCVTGPAPFEEGVLTVEVPLHGRAFGAPVDMRSDGIADVHAALAYGTRRFMAGCGVERVVVGLSGGIDSAVVAALYRSILEPDRLLLVNMPGPFTSPTTVRLAESVAERLGCFYASVGIGPGVEAAVGQIDGLAIAGRGGALRDTLRLGPAARENVQARDRSSRLLAAAAAAFGGVFTCNANKSEATVGYTTLYGDLGGYLANIADLWKRDVYELGRHLNGAVFGREAIPEGCFGVTPSAELSPEQDVDQGKGDPLIYPYHDCLFASWVEWWNRATPEEILEWYAEGVLEQRIGYEGRLASVFPDARAFVADLERWWNLYQGLAVAKRVQAPPVLAVKRRAFGFDHREAQFGPRYTHRYAELKRRLLHPHA